MQENENIYKLILIIHLCFYFKKSLIQYYWKRNNKWDATN